MELLNELVTINKCCLTSIEATEPDALGHSFCHLQCEAQGRCKDVNFCLKIKRAYEEELNTRQVVAEALHRGLTTPPVH